MQTPSRSITSGAPLPKRPSVTSPALLHAARDAVVNLAGEGYKASARDAKAVSDSVTVISRDKFPGVAGTLAHPRFDEMSTSMDKTLQEHRHRSAKEARRFSFPGAAYRGGAGSYISEDRQPRFTL